MRLEEGIKTLMDAQSPAIATLYWGILPAGVTYPAISYTRTTTDRDALLDGPDTLTDIGIEFDIWADTATSVTAAADSLRLLFNGRQGDTGGLTIQYCRFNGENGTHEVDGDFRKYRITVDFVFTLHT